MRTEQVDDRCPYCRSSFEIVGVKFRLSGVAVITACPNCAIASAAECSSKKSKFLGEANQPSGTTRGVWQGIMSRMDSLDLRVRYVLAFMIAAVITAAALRHGVHVYAGIAPEEIRKGALVAIPAVALVIIVLRRKRQR